MKVISRSLQYVFKSQSVDNFRKAFSTEDRRGIFLHFFREELFKWENWSQKIDVDLSKLSEGEFNIVIPRTIVTDMNSAKGFVNNIEQFIEENSPFKINNIDMGSVKTGVSNRTYTVGIGKRLSYFEIKQGIIKVSFVSELVNGDPRPEAPKRPRRLFAGNWDKQWQPLIKDKMVSNWQDFHSPST